MSPLINPLRDILPLFIGSGVAIAFVALVVRQSEPVRIPPLAKRINEWGSTLASFIVVIAVFVALWYVGSHTPAILVMVSYTLLMAAFTLLIVSFLVPAIINAIPYLWVKTFYPQFEQAQSKDLKEVKEAIVKSEDTRETAIE